MRDEVPDFSGWLLLMHQLPSRPAYLRVKVWRSLREAGAIALRHSGYVLPLNAHAASVMRQAVQEIERGKGLAALCEARFIDGITDTKADATSDMSAPLHLQSVHGLDTRTARHRPRDVQHVGVRA